MNTTNGTERKPSANKLTTVNITEGTHRRACVAGAFRRKRIGQYVEDAVLNQVAIDEAAMKNEMNGIPEPARRRGSRS